MAEIEEKLEHPLGYTTEEFEKLVKKGIVPSDLGELGLQQMKEASEQVAASKELMDRCKRENRNPTAEDWVDLEKKFNKNIDQIQKEISLYKFILNNKNYLLKVIEEVSKPKKKFRQSAHYVEQKLKYNKPTKVQEPNLFDILNPETIDKIKNETLQYVGIRLTPPEDRIVNVISRLLEKKSQIIDQGADDFYMGNEPYRLVPYGTKDTGKHRSAVLRCRKSELLNEFFGTVKHSGADIKYFDRVFSSFLEKKWLIRYKRTISTEKKEETKHFIIEDYLPLIKIIKYFPYLSNEESTKVENIDKEFRAIAGEYILALNPILTDQINSKYVEFPEDIDFRTKIAAGSHLAVSEAIVRLRDWLIAEMSAGRYKTEVNEETLILRLHLDKHLKSRKKNRIHEQLTKAVQVCQNLGIILDMEESVGAVGQKKYTFKLNRDF
jgi:hypothetical protein